MIISRAYCLQDSHNNRITLEDECIIGHKRRATQVNVEMPVYIGSNSILEAESINMCTYIGKNSEIKNTKSIGRYTTIGNNCVIGGEAIFENNYLSNSIVLRRGNAIWYNTLLTMDDTKKIPRCRKKPIVIGNDVWIGDNVAIYEGVSVGDGAIINGSAVVDSDVSPYSIMAGNPAKEIGRRFEDKIIELLLNVKWWEMEPNLISDVDMKNDNIGDIIRYFETKIPNIYHGEKIVFDSVKNEIWIKTDSEYKILYKI